MQYWPARDRRGWQWIIRVSIIWLSVIFGQDAARRQPLPFVLTLCDSGAWHASYTSFWQLWQITLSFTRAPAAVGAVIKSCRFTVHRVSRRLWLTLRRIQPTIQNCRLLMNTCLLLCWLSCLHVLRYTEEEIRQKVSTFRQMLMDKEGVITREGSHTQHM